MTREFIKELEEQCFQNLKSSDIQELDKLQATLAWTVFEYVKHMTKDVNFAYGQLTETAERVMIDAIERMNAKMRAINRIRNNRELDVLGVKNN